MIIITIDLSNTIDTKLINDLKIYFSNRPHVPISNGYEICRSFLKERRRVPSLYSEKDLDDFIEKIYNEFIDIRKDEDYIPSVIIKSKHAAGRSVAEKNKRRTDDFNKNTLPTLTGFERKHFESKKKKK